VLQFQPTTRNTRRTPRHHTAEAGGVRQKRARGRRLKLKHHTAEAGGVLQTQGRGRRLKLKHHTAEAGGVWEGRAQRRRVKLKHHRAASRGISILARNGSGKGETPRDKARGIFSINNEPASSSQRETPRGKPFAS
jgi:hypothetical protein